MSGIQDAFDMGCKRWFMMADLVQMEADKPTPPNVEKGSDPAAISSSKAG